MDYQLKKLPRKYIIGIATRTDNKTFQETALPLWGRFYAEQICEKIPSKFSKATVALYSQYESDHQGPFTYLLGCEVSSLDHIPNGLVGMMVPAATYAHFSLEGPYPQSLIQTWQSIWSSHLPRSFTYDFEIYPETFDQKNSPQMGLWINLKS